MLNILPYMKRSCNRHKFMCVYTLQGKTLDKRWPCIYESSCSDSLLTFWGLFLSLWSSNDQWLEYLQFTVSSQENTIQFHIFNWSIYISIFMTNIVSTPHSLGDILFWLNLIRQLKLLYILTQLRIKYIL